MAKTPARPKPAAKPAAKPDAAPPASSGAIDARVVDSMAEIAVRHDLSELAVEHNGLNIRIARHGAAAIAAAAAAPATVAAPSILVTPLAAAPVAAPPVDPNPAGAVKSPMVGTAYRRPSPDSKAFVEIGSQVKAGEKVLLVEAMKTFNEIVAPRAGTISSILVEDGQPVEYGEVLLVIE